MEVDIGQRFKSREVNRIREEVERVGSPARDVRGPSRSAGRQRLAIPP